MTSATKRMTDSEEWVLRLSMMRYNCDTPPGTQQKGGIGNARNRLRFASGRVAESPCRSRRLTRQSGYGCCGADTRTRGARPVPRSLAAAALYAQAPVFLSFRQPGSSGFLLPPASGSDGTSRRCRGVSPRTGDLVWRSASRDCDAV